MIGGEEFYHTWDRYQSQGLDAFLEHAKQYLAGDRTIPVSKSGSPPGTEQLVFTMTSDLLRTFLEDVSLLKKPYDTAMRYGFRRYSRGGKNGAFFQRDEDVKMLDTTDVLLQQYMDEAAQDLDLKEGEPWRLEKIKIVWHNAQGVRVVGVRNPANSRAMFLGFASY